MPGAVPICTGLRGRILAYTVPASLSLKRLGYLHGTEPAKLESFISRLYS